MYRNARDQVLCCTDIKLHIVTPSANVTKWQQTNKQTKQTNKQTNKNTNK